MLALRAKCRPHFLSSMHADNGDGYARARKRRRCWATGTNRLNGVNVDLALLAAKPTQKVTGGKMTLIRNM